MQLTEDSLTDSEMCQRRPPSNLETDLLLTVSEIPVERMVGEVEIEGDGGRWNVEDGR